MWIQNPPGFRFVTNWIAVGDSGTILSSIDAVNWSVTNIAGGGILNDITTDGYGDFSVATAHSTGTYYWDTWPTSLAFVTLPGAPVGDYVTRFDDQGINLVTTGGDPVGGNRIWTSDGAGSLNSWTNTANIGGAATGIAYGNGKFIVVGWQAPPYESTNDGNSWFSVYSPVLDPNHQGLPLVGHDIVFGNGMFVVAQAGYFAESMFVTTNGITWSGVGPINSDPTNQWVNITSIAYGNGTFVGASSGPDTSGTIPIGIYQSMPVSTPFITTTQLTNTNAMDIVISGQVGRKYRLLTSPDLTTWSNLWIYTNTAPTMEYIDPINQNLGQRFYRVVSP
jgi:hypothetical protein